VRTLLRDVVEILLGMNGILLRRLSALRLGSTVLRLGAIALLVGLYYALLAPRPRLSWAIVFFGLATLVHYVALFGLFARGPWESWAQALIRRHGEEEGFARGEALLALVFCLNGLSTGYVCSVPGGLDFLPRPLVIVLGVGLFAVGLTVKVWATRIVSLDTYYYRDMFLGRPVGDFKAAGPYRVFQNPMYGVGHLHAYGLALVAGSLPGLVAVACNQACIWAFYFLVEAPHVHQLYVAPKRGLPVTGE
jgi:protein-S-isoprenylcysteine O-methyltransferase Ste14